MFRNIIDFVGFGCRWFTDGLIIPRWLIIAMLVGAVGSFAFYSRLPSVIFGVLVAVGLFGFLVRGRTE